ncbi:hypothetical protein N9W31_01895 [Litoricolaceae bacterium]|nr:hypothetical protein [Litorivicinaceae bacterium]
MRWLNRAGATVTLLLGLVIVVETLLELIENGTSIYTEADGLVWYALILTHLVSVGLFVGGILWSLRAWRSPKDETQAQAD